MFRHIPPRNIDSPDGGGHGEAFVDGYGMGDTVAGVEDDAGGTAGGVEGENSLDTGIEGRDVEGFEEDLGGCVTVCAGIEGRFG